MPFEEHSCLSENDKENFKKKRYDFSNAKTIHCYQINVSGRLDYLTENFLNLTTLIIKFGKLCNEDFALITRCSNLLTLELIENDFTKFERIERLRKLICFKAESLENDLNISEIFKLKNLKYLKIMMIHFTKLQVENNSGFWKEFQNFFFKDLKYCVILPWLEEKNSTNYIK